MKYYIKTKDIDTKLESMTELPEAFKAALKAALAGTKGAIKEYLILSTESPMGISVTDAGRNEVPKEVLGANKSIVLL